MEQLNLEKELQRLYIRRKIIQEVTGLEILALGAGSITALWIYKTVMDLYDVKTVETALSDTCFEESYLSVNIIPKEDFEEGLKEKLKNFIKSFFSGKNRILRYLVKSGYVDLITRRAVAEYFIKQNPKSPISKALVSGSKMIEVTPSQFESLIKSFIPLKHRLLKTVPDEFEDCDRVAFKYTLIVTDALLKIIKENKENISKIVISFQKIS